MTDSELEELLDGIDFDLDPIFVIHTYGTRIDQHWYVHHIEFVAASKVVRKIYWTKYQTQALHFSNWDDAFAFTQSQFGTRSVSIKEL